MPAFLAWFEETVFVRILAVPCSKSAAVAANHQQFAHGEQSNPLARLIGRAQDS